MNRKLSRSVAFGLTAVALGLCPLATAHAQEAKAEKKADAVKKMIVIGPDGKRHEIELGKDAHWVAPALGGAHGWLGRVQGKVVVVGPDGKKHEIDLGKDGKPAPGVAVKQGKVTVIGPDGKKHEIDLGNAGRWVAPLGAGRVRLGNVQGKVTVIGPDGKKHEIDLSKAGKPAAPGVGVKQGQKMVFVGPDGKMHTIEIPQGKVAWQAIAPLAGRKGKMVFVGPDGKKHEVEMGNFGGFRFFNVPKAGGFMLGVHCEPASEVLRTHLGLKEGVGLVVEQVIEGTPASKAGLRKHDVLVTAGKTSLGSVEALGKAVTEAGKAKKPLTLSLRRAGKTMQVEVAPAERKPVKVEVEGKKGPQFSGGRFLWRVDPDTKAPGLFRVGPKGDLEKRLDELTKKVAELEKALRNLDKDD